MRTSLVRFLPRLLRCGCTGIALLLAAALPARATSVVAPTFDELVNQSDYIVQAVVKSVVPEGRVTPSGSHTIFSRVELEVKEVVAGTPPARVVLEVLGGTLNGRTLAIEGAPKFAVGDEGIYFVQGNGRQIYPLVRMMHGVYPVRLTDGKARVFRSDGAPLTDVSGVAHGPDRSVQAAAALTTTEFIAQIRAAAHEPHLLQQKAR